MPRAHRYCMGHGSMDCIRMLVEQTSMRGQRVVEYAMILRMCLSC
jgi:hypothetical protein